MGLSISLIVPVYNVERYLAQCLESIVNQTVLFDEVILIDDGSVDKSPLICRQYVSVYPYIRLISQENRGLSAARNRGLMQASGQYVMFLDSDDYLRTDTVKILKEQLLKFRYDAVYFDAETHCEEGKYFVEKNIYDRSGAGLDGNAMSGWEYFSRCYPGYYVVQVCMAVYRRKLISDAGIWFPEELLYEDNYFSFVFMNHAECVVHISEKLYQRRYRKNSITTSAFSERKFRDIIKINLLIWEEIIKGGRLFKGDTERELLLSFIRNCCSITLEKYQLCREQKIGVSAETEELFYHMAEQYYSVLQKVYQRAGIVSLGISCLNNIGECLLDISSILTEGSREWKRVMKETAAARNLLYQRLLAELPLNKEGLKIAIYGTGKHTEGLLTAYEKTVAPILCELVFLDTRRDNEKYHGRKLINYRRIDKSIHMIVISSFLYEKEMLNNVKEISGEIPVYTFYKDLKQDIFSGFRDFLDDYD